MADTCDVEFRREPPVKKIEQGHPTWCSAEGEMMKAFNRPEIAVVAEEVESVIIQMVNDASGASSFPRTPSTDTATS
jgi:hypothetical protein